MGTEEGTTKDEGVDEEVEDLEATEGEGVTGGLKFEQDVIEYKSNTPDGRY